MKVLKYNEYLLESTKSTANILKLRDMIISDIVTDFKNNLKLSEIILKDYKNFFDDSEFVKFLSGNHKIVFEENQKTTPSYDAYKSKNMIFRYDKTFLIQLIELVKLGDYDFVEEQIKEYFSSDISHELQHLYDDYISKYSLFKHEKDYDSIEHKLNNKYYNFTHEINARFTQFVDTYDFNNKDFNTVLRDFKKGFGKYDKVFKENLPKLHKKLYHYWQNYKKEDI